MATMTHILGTLTDFHLAYNLNSLAHNQIKVLGGYSAGAPYVDNSSLKYPSANLYFLINLPTSGMLLGGTIELYLLKCLTTPGTSTNWSEGINPADTNDVSAYVYNLAPIMTFNATDQMNSVDIMWVCNDLSTWKFKDVDGVVREVGELPPYWTLAVWNKSGNTLISSGHTAKYQLRSYASA